MKDHFEGRPIPEHLKEARARGAIASAEVHGTEMPGHLSAGADSAKETTLALLLLWTLLGQDHTLLFLLFSIGWIVWKVGRSAALGWARLERLHRLIEEERWEIEHNRPQEKEELTALYQAKGLEGKLLKDVIDVLMADDSRLLNIMLEEELGLTLEIHEHPLKQAFGAFVGATLAAGLFFIAVHILHLPFLGPYLVGAFVIGFASFIAAKAEKNRKLEAVIWNLAIGAFALSLAHFFKNLLDL